MLELSSGAKTGTIGHEGVERKLARMVIGVHLLRHADLAIGAVKRVALKVGISFQTMRSSRSNSADMGRKVGRTFTPLRGELAFQRKRRANAVHPKECAEATNPSVIDAGFANMALDIVEFAIGFPLMSWRIGDGLRNKVGLGCIGSVFAGFDGNA